jgi:hypothetical protein
MASKHVSGQTSGVRCHKSDEGSESIANSHDNPPGSMVAILCFAKRHLGSLGGFLQAFLSSLDKFIMRQATRRAQDVH